MIRKTVTIPADSTTSGEIDINAFSVNEILSPAKYTNPPLGQITSVIFPDTMTGTNLSVQKKVGEDWKTLFFFGTPYAIPVVDGITMIEPGQAYILNGLVRFVSNETELDERTLQVEIIKIT